MSKNTEYNTKPEKIRLGKQLSRVKNLMLDGQWRTPAEVVAALGEMSETGASSFLRDLRKPQFGKHDVRRRDRAPHLSEYKLFIDL